MILTKLEKELYTHLDQLLDYVLYLRMITKCKGPNEPDIQKMIKTVGDIKYKLRREKANEHNRCDRKG